MSRPSILTAIKALKDEGYSLKEARDIATLVRDNLNFTDQELENARLRGFEQGVKECVEFARLSWRGEAK